MNTPEQPCAPFIVPHKHDTIMVGVGHHLLHALPHVLPGLPVQSGYCVERPERVTEIYISQKL
jgi:hypothetical protein